MDFNTLCFDGKKNKYSTLRFTYLVVPRRLWRHNCISRSLTMLSTNGEIVWQPVCENRVDILSTHSKNSSLGLVLAVDGVEH